MALYPFFVSPTAHRLGHEAGWAAPLLNLPLLEPGAAQTLVWVLLLLALAGLLGARLRPLLAPLSLGYAYFLCLDFKAWWGLSAPLLALALAVLAGAGRRPLRLLWWLAAAAASLECTGFSGWTLLQWIVLALPWRWPALPVLFFQGLTLEGPEYALLMSAWLLELERVEKVAGWPALVPGLAVLLACGLNLPPGVESLHWSFVRNGQPQRLDFGRPQGSSLHSAVAMQPPDLLPPAALRARQRCVRDFRFYQVLAREWSRRWGVPITVEKTDRLPGS
jgi:hypothetical protein